MAPSKITTIKKLKETFYNQLSMKYSGPIGTIERKIEAIKIQHNKQLVSDLEGSLVESFPFLKRTVRCDYRHSDYTTDTITLVFKVDTVYPEVERLFKEKSELVKKYNDKRVELEAWEIKALMANLKAEGVPEFNIED